MVEHVVRRFSFTPIERFTVKLPADAEILTVDRFGQQPCMWALCRPGAELKDYHFVLATDERVFSLPATWQYVGSFNIAERKLHIFEVFD